MTIRKRLRQLLAAWNQDWTIFRCSCGKEVYVSDGAGKLLDGQLCDACEAKAFAAWEKDFVARQQNRTGAA